MTLSAREMAEEIALWLYGPDEGLSEGLVRTLIDKIELTLLTYGKQVKEAAARTTGDDIAAQE